MTPNPIDIQALIMAALQQSFTPERGFHVFMEQGRALADSEYPAAIITFDSGDIRPRVAGDDPRAASVVGNRYVYRYFVDISVRNQALARLSTMFDLVVAAGPLFRARSPALLLAFEGVEGIQRTEDARDDIRSIRFRLRVETT